MAFQYASQFNAFIPAATGQIIGYIRDPEKYLVNKYAQMIRSDKPVFVYYKLHRDDMGQRVPSTADDVWSDGAKRPESNNEGFRFDTVEGQTIRRQYDFVIGWQALQNADIKLLLVNTLSARNKMMTAFTRRVTSMLETAANWGDNTSTAAALINQPGHWDTASDDPTDVNYLAIKRCLDEALYKIKLATNGAVDGNDEAPKLLINPKLALKMSQAPEIRNYIRESPDALAQILGRKKGQNAKWGLPEQLYGFDILVEDSSYVSERPQADGGFATSPSALVSESTATRKFVKSSTSAVILQRVGGIDGVAGTPSFSTVQVYYHDVETAVEVVDEPWDKRTKGSVVAERDEILAAPESGWLLTDLLSVA